MEWTGCELTTLFMHSKQKYPVKEVLKRNNHFLSVHDTTVWVTSKHVPVAVMRDEKQLVTEFTSSKTKPAKVIVFADVSRVFPKLREFKWSYWPAVLFLYALKCVQREIVLIHLQVALLKSVVKTFSTYSKSQTFWKIIQIKYTTFIGCSFVFTFF